MKRHSAELAFGNRYGLALQRIGAEPLRLFLVTLVLVGACFTTTQSSQAEGITFEPGAKMVIETRTEVHERSARRTTDRYTYRGLRGEVHVFVGRDNKNNPLLIELRKDGSIKRFRRGSGKTYNSPHKGVMHLRPGQKGRVGDWKQCKSSRPVRLEFKTVCTGRLVGSAARGQNRAKLVIHRDAESGWWFRREEVQHGVRTSKLMRRVVWEMTIVPEMRGKVLGF